MHMLGSLIILLFLCFFFNDTATTEIYTLSLHDALPIWWQLIGRPFATTMRDALKKISASGVRAALEGDRKSTRLNSSHGYISYAVFCLKKKNHPRTPKRRRHHRRPLRPQSRPLRPFSPV